MEAWELGEPGQVGKVVEALPVPRLVGSAREGRGQEEELAAAQVLEGLVSAGPLAPAPVELAEMVV